MHLAIGLSELGHRVTICCIDRSVVDLQSCERAGVEVVCLHAQKRISRALAIPRIARLARRFDVVHCTMWDASLWGRLGAILARRPVVIADHATDRSIQISTGGVGRGAWIARHNRLLDRFTYATVACASTQYPVLVDEGVAPEKIVHIVNGIPMDQTRRDAVDGPTRADLGIPDDAKVVMQVGVFRHEKNQLGALDALAPLHERDDRIHLVFVGNGRLREQVERRAAELGGDWAHFLGFRDDVPGLLALADLMILPSISDAMPMTVLEAMALGVPIVATDVGDVRETLGESAGICVPAGDPEAFAQACARLLEDDELRAATGAAGRARSSEFDAVTMAARYSELLVAAQAARQPRGHVARRMAGLSR